MVSAGHYVVARERNPISRCWCVQLPIPFITGGCGGGRGGVRGMFCFGQRHVCFIQFYDKHTVNFEEKNCQGLNSGTDLI